MEEFTNKVGPTLSDESRNESLENIIEVINDNFGIWSLDDEDYEDDDRYLVYFGVGGPA